MSKSVEMTLHLCDGDSVLVETSKEGLLQYTVVS